MVSRLLTASAALLAIVGAFGAASIAGAWPISALALAASLVAAARPPVALMLVAALAPLGGAIGALAGERTSATDALVLGALAGWLVRRAMSRERWDPLSIWLAGLFVVVVLTSLLTQCVLIHQLVAPASLSLPRAVLQWLSASSSLPRHPFRPEVTAAVRLMAGLGLFVMTVEVCRRHRPPAISVLVLLVFGVSAVAALSVNRFLEVVLRRGGDLWSTALELHRFVRISAMIGDVNAAGAMFALVLPAAAALCVARRTRLIGVVSLATLCVGLWLTGSRAGMVGGAAGLVAYLMMLARRRWTRPRVVLAAVALALAIGGVVVWYPRSAAHAAATDAYLIRKYLAMASVEMARESPLFGVGIGRFRAESPRYAPKELRRYYRAENAHNQVLQVLGELGVPGVVLFLALLASSLLPRWRQLGDPSSEAFRAPATLGVWGFTLASVLMHPLLAAEPAAAFWLMLGLARSSVAAPPPERRVRRGEIVAWVALAIGLAAAVPGRVAATRHSLRLDGVGIGLSKWQRDRDTQIAYRRATATAVIFVDGQRGRLRVPLRLAGGRALTPVSVWLDGRPAGQLTLAPDAWTEYAFVMPEATGSRPRYRRLEFRWTPMPKVRLHIGRESYDAPVPVS